MRVEGLGLRVEGLGLDRRITSALSLHFLAVGLVA